MPFKYAREVLPFLSSVCLPIVTAIQLDKAQMNAQAVEGNAAVLFCEENSVCEFNVQ